MNKDIEDLKTRLRDDAVRAAEAERAFGLIEDVARSITNVGLLKPKLVVVGGEVMLCVHLEEIDTVEVVQNIVFEPDEICGCDVVMRSADNLADLSYYETAVAWNMLEGGATDQQIADLLNRALDQFQDRLVEMRQELEGSAASAVVDADDQPSPAPKPPAAAPSKPTPAKSAKRKRTPSFSDPEIKRMVHLWRNGNKATRIAEILGCETKKVANYLTNHRELFPLDLSAPAKPKTPKFAPKGQQAPAVRSIVPTPGARIHFTPDQDLKLAIHMQEGAGIGGAAALLRIKRDLCQARWNELLPEKTPQAIEALIKRLQNTDCAKVAS